MPLPGQRWSASQRRKFNQTSKQRKAQKEAKATAKAAEANLQTTPAKSEELPFLNFLIQGGGKDPTAHSEGQTINQLAAEAAMPELLSSRIAKDCSTARRVLMKMLSDMLHIERHEDVPAVTQTIALLDEYTRFKIQQVGGLESLQELGARVRAAMKVAGQK